MHVPILGHYLAALKYWSYFGILFQSKYGIKNENFSFTDTYTWKGAITNSVSLNIQGIYNTLVHLYWRGGVTYFESPH